MTDALRVTLALLALALCVLLYPLHWLDERRSGKRHTRLLLTPRYRGSRWSL